MRAINARQRPFRAKSLRSPFRLAPIALAPAGSLALALPAAALESDGGAVSWTYRYPDGSTKDFRRDGNRIECTIEGSGGEAKKAAIDSLPWFASLNFGLAELARKGVMDQVFWVVNPDNGKPYKMDARINGLPTAFFSMDFWYRKGDFAFVKSVGAEDGPGSPITVVELVGP